MPIQFQFMRYTYKAYKCVIERLIGIFYRPHVLKKSITSSLFSSGYHKYYQYFVEDFSYEMFLINKHERNEKERKHWAVLFIIVRVTCQPV